MSRFNRCWFFALVVFSVAADASVRTWPGTSPCDTTLQACLDGSANNDTVLVQSSAVIAESPRLNKPLSLLAAPGFHPVLAAGNSISAFYSPGAGVSWSVDVEGFSLLDGYVRITQSTGQATITLRHLDVVTNTTYAVGTSVLLENYGSDAMTYEIADNRVQLQNPSDSITAIEVYAYNNTPSTGRTHDNRISANGAVATGLGINANGPGSSMQIYANQLSGNFGIGIEAYSFANATALLLSNSVACAPAGSGFGIEVVPFGGSLSTQVFNNSVVACNTGLEFNGSSVSGRVANNLLAGNTVEGIYLPSGLSATLSNDHNLIFGSPQNNYMPGPGTLTSDPLLLRGTSNPRLGAGSPAIDAADSAALQTLLGNNALPEIDADGTRRFKGAGNSADIGAFEYGDIAITEIASSANGGVIDNVALNGNSAALPQLVQNQNPDTYVCTTYYSGLTGLNYSSAHFGVINESVSTPRAGTGYNVFVPAPGNGAYLHTTSASNVFGFTTELDNSYINSQPNRIVLATHRSTPLFNHTFGLAYFSGHWFLQQNDAVSGGPNFPSGLNFHIYAQDASLNAFVWAVPSGATNVTTLDHPLLNNEPCGRVYVSTNNLNPHPFEVYYSQSRWNIANVDGATLPAGTTFNVVVDEAAIQFCRYDHIYHDGFGNG